MRLRHLFHELESVKDDSQQRSWFLHEDEQTICQHIKELIAILVSSTFSLEEQKYTLKIDNCGVSDNEGQQYPAARRFSVPVHFVHISTNYVT